MLFIFSPLKQRVIHECDYESTQIAFTVISLFVSTSTSKYLVSIHFSLESHQIIN